MRDSPLVPAAETLSEPSTAMLRVASVSAGPGRGVAVSGLPTRSRIAPETNAYDLTSSRVAFWPIATT